MTFPVKPRTWQIQPLWVINSSMLQVSFIFENLMLLIKRRERGEAPCHSPGCWRFETCSLDFSDGRAGGQESLCTQTRVNSLQQGPTATWSGAQPCAWGLMIFNTPSAPSHCVDCAFFIFSIYSIRQELFDRLKHKTIQLLKETERKSIWPWVLRFNTKSTIHTRKKKSINWISLKWKMFAVQRTLRE